MYSINYAMPLCQSFHIEYLYGCKAEDEEEQDLSCTCMKLQQKGKLYEATLSELHIYNYKQ